MQYETVLGMEAAASAADEMHPKGLCNAVIVARASAEFIKLWLDSYESFDKDKWSQHSVVSLPGGSLTAGNALDACKTVSHPSHRSLRACLLLASVD